MRYKRGGSICGLALAGSVAAFGAAHGEEARAGSDLDTVVVTGRVRSLEQFTPTGSRLGLSARETPGTLDSVNAEAMTVLGLLTVEKAAESLPGVNTGGSPGNPATFSMRGFTDGQRSPPTPKSHPTGA